MWLKQMPWRWLLSRLARARGFIDPINVLSRLHHFAQPSEVSEPIELLRAGVIFHARGLINTRAIQHNLDWVWPYWVERQFDPHDVSFVPRAFSITHVNLTHRNWTAVGQPDCDWLPIVDPRGLLTPLYDGWSLDAWVIPEEGPRLLPSRAEQAAQELRFGDSLAVETQVRNDCHELRSRADVAWENEALCCRMQLAAQARGRGAAWLAVALRPVNPEGISFIHSIRWDQEGLSFRVNDEASVVLSDAPTRVCMSHYHHGDVLQDLPHAAEVSTMTDKVGLATAAALYRLEELGPTGLTVRIPLGEVNRSGPTAAEPWIAVPPQPVRWSSALEGHCTLNLPDEHLVFLFDAAARSLILHSPGDVYPGPFTYKRFWFRDAAFILNALLALGMTNRVARTLQEFPSRQTRGGYFQSQEGEWDSNGQAIWILDRYQRLSGQRLSDDLMRAVIQGAKWICRKRVSDDSSAAHAGLLPAGFSAEHLGPNDYYYWDDFWSAAGLLSAASLVRENGDDRRANEYQTAATELLTAVDRSLELTAARRGRPGIPASPYRRMDAGAIGSLAAGYPLALWRPRDPRLLDTVDFLLEHCTVRDVFFQDIIHSGLNAYLTLHMAQVLLRAGDERFLELVEAVARLASPTGQWPEAIHPHTLGGCMGDGQHIWAAAEWVLMMRSLFVQEEGNRLVLGSGLVDKWLARGALLRLGPTPTSFGPLTVEVESRDDAVRVKWEAEWRATPPAVEVALPGHKPLVVDGGQGSAIVPRRRDRHRVSPATSEAPR